MNTPRKNRPLGISASAYRSFNDCERQWWLRYVEKVPTVMTAALQMGIDIHEWLEYYLKGAELPEMDERLVSIAEAGLEHLPAPGTVEVEEWLVDSCGPLPFRGKVDFYKLEEDGTLHIWDHKTTGRINNAKTPTQLAKDFQLLAYAWVLVKMLKDLGKTVNKVVGHHVYYITTKNKVPTSFPVHAEISWEDIKKNWTRFERAAKTMSALAKVDSQGGIAPDVSKCRFCWVKEHCTAYPKNKAKQKQVGEIVDTVDIKKRVADRIAAQTAAKAAAKAQKKKDKKAKKVRVVELHHPSAPKDEPNWGTLADLLIEDVSLKAADGVVFTRKNLADFLLFHIFPDEDEGEIEDSWMDRVMAATNGALFESKKTILVDVNRFSKPKKEKKKTKKKKAKKVKSGEPAQDAPGLSAFIDMVRENTAPFKLPGTWTPAQAEKFLRSVLLRLSSTETLSDQEVRELGRDAIGGTRMARLNTVKKLVEYGNLLGVPLELVDEDAAALRLGVSDAEEAMAHAIVLPPPIEDTAMERRATKEAAQEWRLRQEMSEALALDSVKARERRAKKEAQEQKVEAPPVVVKAAPVKPAPSLSPVVVYINAMPTIPQALIDEGLATAPTPLSTILAPLQEAVAAEKGVDYYHLVAYEKGPSYVASKLIALLNGCHASEVLGSSCYVMLRDPCLGELLPIFSHRSDIIIVRGL